MPTTIGITSGDPSGIGLEVTFKALPSVLSAARWVLFSDREALARNLAAFPLAVPHRWISSVHDISDDRVLFVVDTAAATRDNGERAMACLEAACDAALAGSLQAIVTAPVNKAAIGRHFKGQTEFLAERARVSEFAMAFFTPTFKVVLATIHVSLRDALERLTRPHYVRLIAFVDREFRRLGAQKPRIAIAGVNPHAGENGMFGREEIDILSPAVAECRNMGISVSGPWPADSLYYRAHSGEFDVVIAPYHDQGLAPVKLIAHGTSTNVTLGLPYVRTSPDHGTAFDIAGKGLADEAGMLSAMRCAVDLCRLAQTKTPRPS